MAYETILFEMRGPVGLLTLNRPDKLNAINGKMVQEVNGLLDRVERDAEVRALVVTGAGRAFSAGFDLTEGADRPWNTVGDVRPVLQADFDFVMRFWHSPLPTVAAVKGYALAGACWLPVVWIQIEVARLAATVPPGAPLPARHHRLMWCWFALGWPAFIALAVVFWLMVAKPTLW